MQITHLQLPQSRQKYTAELSELEVAEYFEQAVKRLSASIKITGFRPGKAPANLVRDQLKPEALREEAYTLAVQGAWLDIVKKLETQPIHDPEVEVADFTEGKPAQIIFEFDVRPDVTVKDWQKIIINKAKKEPVTEEQVADILTSLQKAHAKTIISLEPAKKGDKVEVSFVGSLKGVTKEKLSSKHFPLIIGEQSVIPGFAEELIGCKKSETKKFQLTFPADHFDKELADQKIDFEATIDDVYTVNLPELNDELAKKFGHDKLDQLKSAVREDLATRGDEEFFIQQKAEWLAEFEKCVTVELPKSLVDAEVARSRGSWEEFLQKRQLKAADWLERQKTTLEEMEKNWRLAAESSVKIGLGLAKIAEEAKKPLQSNEQYQQFLDEQVQAAITTSSK